MSDSFTQPGDAGSSREPRAALPFHLAAFSGAFLLFTLELMIGRMLLPVYGNSASVWTTCLVYFQGLLLLGYWYAARISSTRSRSIPWWHLGLVILPVATFPFHLVSFDIPPMAGVVLSLSVAIGLPFFVLSSASVVAQAWFARTGHPRAGDPYFLYASSNAGALLALLLYPFVIEPAMGMARQRLAWYGAYLLHILLMAWCVSKVRAAHERRAQTGGNESRRPVPVSMGDAEAGDGPPVRQLGEPGRLDTLQWLMLSAGANAVLMAATNVMTLDAPVPLLWVVPLAIYLATLIICFGRRAPGPRLIGTLGGAGIAVAIVAMLFLVAKVHIQGAFITFHAAMLWVGCLLCHFRLVRARPSDPSRLGKFYLCMSAGGWLGALLAGILVPLALHRVTLSFLDYLAAFGLILAALMIRDARVALAYFRLRPSRAVALGLLFALAISLGVTAAARLLEEQVDGARTFYGIYRIADRDGLRWFQHGNTIHGVQSLDDTSGRVPLGYYYPDSPIGRIFTSSLAFQAVGIVGLGAGALAAYQQPGQTWDFFELDPEVERIARQDFTFLRGAVAPTRVIIGDARLTLRDVEAERYDLLVLDTFSSDFLPLHLVTREAIELYFDKLAPDGLLVFHISSRVFDILPVLERLALDLDLFWAVGGERVATGQQTRVDRFPGLWFAATYSSSRHEQVLELPPWQTWEVSEEIKARRVWTDDYVNLFDAL